MVSSRSNRTLQLKCKGCSVGKKFAGQTKAVQTELASLYEEYYDRIARYIFIRIGDRTEAEDLAGEVFLRALRSLDSYQSQSERVRAWLFRVAHNLAIDHLRKMSKRRAQSLDGIEIQDDVCLEEVMERTRRNLYPQYKNAYS